MEKVLSVEQVAEILQVKALTVREMFREKRLRAFKIGKSWRTTESILQADLDALARGESPCETPMPGAPVSPPAKAAKKARKAPASSAEETPAPVKEAASSGKKRRAETTEEDDTQPFLF
jgi:excisionase family DNA binding protein